MMSKSLRKENLSTIKIVSCHLDDLSSSAISSTGEVFTLGSNTNGLLGDGTKINI